MDNVVRFVSKSELERERLIREARAIYDSIFPPASGAGERGRPGGDACWNGTAPTQPEQC